MKTVSEIAEYIWEEEIGGPASISSSLIASNLKHRILGQMNSLLYTDFTYKEDVDAFVVRERINREFGERFFCLEEDEISVLILLYLIKYYNKKAAEALSGFGQNSYWTEIREETGNAIKRSSPTEIARYFNELAKTKKDELDDVVEGYRTNNFSVQGRDYYCGKDFVKERCDETHEDFLYDYS